MSCEFTQYIGIPWEEGAQGPDAFDCGGLVRWIYLYHFGLELPRIFVEVDNIRAVIRRIAAEKNHGWQQVAAPAHGVVVTMAHASHPSHVGVWLDIDGGGVIHCVQGSGVIFSSLAALALAGWGKLEFYRHD